MCIVLCPLCRANRSVKMLRSSKICQFISLTVTYTTENRMRTWSPCLLCSTRMLLCHSRLGWKKLCLRHEQVARAPPKSEETYLYHSPAHSPLVRWWTPPSSCCAAPGRTWLGSAAAGPPSSLPLMHSDISAPLPPCSHPPPRSLLSIGLQKTRAKLFRDHSSLAAK